MYSRPEANRANANFIFHLMQKSKDYLYCSESFIITYTMLACFSCIMKSGGLASNLVSLRAASLKYRVAVAMPAFLSLPVLAYSEYTYHR